MGGSRRAPSPWDGMLNQYDERPRRPIGTNQLPVSIWDRTDTEGPWRALEGFITNAVITTEALTKFYGKRRGLDGLDMAVRSGEVYGFLGPNGAGKTTTIRLLLDVLRPTSGQARVLDLDPRADGVRLRRRVGYLPGDFIVDGRQDSRHLLDHLAALRGGVDRHRIDELIDRFELDADILIRSLSKGNRQKVGLIQAFMHQPELLILDEPTSGLDPLMQREVHTLIGEAAEQGQTVFMSSHVLSEVQAIADRVGIIRDGRLAAVEDVETLRARAIRHVTISFNGHVPPGSFDSVQGIEDVALEDSTLRCTLTGWADELIKAASRFEVVSIQSEEPDLEQMFFTFYEGGGGAHVA